MKAAPLQPLEISQCSCELKPILSAATLIGGRGPAKIAVAGRILSQFLEFQHRCEMKIFVAQPASFSLIRISWYAARGRAHRKDHCVRNAKSRLIASSQLRYGYPPHLRGDAGHVSG
jgi:hypothetical protein